MIEHSSATAVWLWLWLFGVSLLSLAGTLLISFRRSGGTGRHLLRWAVAFSVILAAERVTARLGGWFPDVSKNTLTLLGAAVLLLGGSLAIWTLLAALFQRSTERGLRWAMFLLANGAWMLALSSEKLGKVATSEQFDEAQYKLGNLRDDDLIETRGVPLITDGGQPITTYRVEGTWEEAVETHHQSAPERKLGLMDWTILQSPPDWTANCHGWVFTGGQYIIRGRDVDGILADNRYRRVDQARTGDLIVYRSLADNSVLHTGVVRVAEAGITLIESKWGLWGRYLHQPEHQPYSDDFAYYRSPRRGHELARQPHPLSPTARQRLRPQTDRKKRIQLSCITPRTSVSL
jgi:hypothetical protein